jgi:hypothetical protein
MSNRTLVISLMIIFVLLITACAPANTEAPAATEPPAATESPEATEPPAATEPPSPTPDPFTPQLCNPDQPALAPLVGIDNVESEYGDEFVSYQGTYTNSKGQIFQLTASSLPDPENPYALVFLESLRVCFEALESGNLLESNKLDADLDAEREVRADILRQMLPMVDDHQPYNVDVLMQWLSQDLELESKNEWVIHYYIDPTIDSDDGVDGFRAKCSTSGRVRPDLRGRSLVSSSAFVTPSLWRAGSSLGSVTATGGSLYPSGVGNSVSPRYTTYDARVSGTRGQSYALEGSWTENNSSISSTVCP